MNIGAIKAWSLSPKRWWEWLVVLIIVLISNLGAMNELYNSYAIGVPYGKSDEAIHQRSLWIKNLDCIREEKDILIGKTDNNTQIKVAICECSGDVILQVTYPDGDSYAKWVSAESFCSSENSPSHAYIWFYATAHASMQLQKESKVRPLYQEQVSDRLLYRRVFVPDTNKCYEQMIDMYLGKVLRDKEYICSDININHCAECHQYKDDIPPAPPKGIAIE